MTTALVLISFALALYYPVMLNARSDWRANSAAKGLMRFSIIVVLVLALGVYRQLVEPPPIWARNAAYLLIIFGLAAQNITLTRVQNRRARRIENERREGIEQLKEKESRK